MERMMRWRWVELLLGITLFSLAAARGELKNFFIAFAIGAVIGFIIDLIGIAWLHLWVFPRQTFLSKEYFALVIPGWGIFGSLVNALWDYSHDLPSWLIFLLLTAMLFFLCEFSNLKTKTWKYRAPWWTIVLGWFPLILSLRIIFILCR